MALYIVSGKKCLPSSFSLVRYATVYQNFLLELGRSHQVVFFSDIYMTSFYDLLGLKSHCIRNFSGMRVCPHLEAPLQIVRSPPSGPFHVRRREESQSQPQIFVRKHRRQCPESVIMTMLQFRYWKATVRYQSHDQLLSNVSLKVAIMRTFVLWFVM